MKVEIKCNPDILETTVIIITNKVDQEVLSLQEKIMNSSPSVLFGFYEDRLEIIELDEIIRAYAYDGKVFIITETKEYVIRLSLYEVEDRLDKGKFVRISRSDIINLKKVKNFDLSFVGTISVEMVNGDIVYVSRRNLKRIKELLGI